MRFEHYRVLILTLFSISMTALAALLVCLALAPSNGWRAGEKTLYVIAFLAMGSASLVNVACGTQHRKMWGRGGLRSYAKHEQACYLIDRITFSVGGIFMLVLTAKFWLLPV